MLWRGLVHVRSIRGNIHAAVQQLDADLAAILIKLHA